MSVKSVEEVIRAEAHPCHCILYSHTTLNFNNIKHFCVDKFLSYF
jgi:hypothetical protein